MDSTQSNESEAFYTRDFLLGDSTGLLSELVESEEEEEEEISISYQQSAKLEKSDSSQLHPKTKREPDTQLTSQPLKYARHEKGEYEAKEDSRAHIYEPTKRDDHDGVDFRDPYLTSPKTEFKDQNESSFSYRKRFLMKASSPAATARQRRPYTRSPVTSTSTPSKINPTEYHSSPSSTISDFYQLPINENHNDSLERNVSVLHITKEDTKKELPTPAQEHHSPVLHTPPQHPRYVSPIRTPENIPNVLSTKFETPHAPVYRSDVPSRHSDPTPTYINDPKSNNDLHKMTRNNIVREIDSSPARIYKPESPVYKNEPPIPRIGRAQQQTVQKENVFIAPAPPVKPKQKTALDDPFQISSDSHIPNIPRPGENVTVNKNEYSILRQVGEGASGKVFQVYSHTHTDIFALKWVLIKKEEDRQSILNEIKLLVSLRNETSIVRLYDHSNTPKVIYMIMEYGDVSFQQIIANQASKKWDLTFIRYYWLQMLNAVNTIHEHNIVHSDLKPANFVIVKGYLKLIDFGIAKKVSDDTTNIERDVPVGTVNYMAPEALIDINEGRDDARLTKQGRPSDVWSLGCILYQMVYGKPPFYHLTMHQRVVHIVNKNYKIKFEPTTTHNNCTIEVPSMLTSILRGCLDRDPTMRSPMLELLTHSFVNS